MSEKSPKGWKMFCVFRIQCCRWRGYIVNKTTLLSAALPLLCKHSETWQFNPFKEAKRFGSLVGAAHPQPWDVGTTWGSNISSTATAGRQSQPPRREPPCWWNLPWTESQDSRASWDPWGWGKACLDAAACFSFLLPRVKMTNRRLMP